MSPSHFLSMWKRTDKKKKCVCASRVRDVCDICGSNGTINQTCTEFTALTCTRPWRLHVSSCKNKTLLTVSVNKLRKIPQKHWRKTFLRKTWGFVCKPKQTSTFIYLFYFSLGEKTCRIEQEWVVEDLVFLIFNFLHFLQVKLSYIGLTTSADTTASRFQRKLRFKNRLLTWIMAVHGLNTKEVNIKSKTQSQRFVQN